MKGFGELGLAQAGIKLIGPATSPPTRSCPTWATCAGRGHHVPLLGGGDRPANKAFVAEYKKAYGPNAWPNFISVARGTRCRRSSTPVIQQKGKLDPDKTMAILKGWKNPDSPRGPISIDPETRDIIQNEYVREVRKVDGVLANVELETIKAVKDPWKEITGKK